VIWLWIGLGFILGFLLVLGLLLALLYVHLRLNYLDYLVRIFRERPLFIIPRGQPTADGVDVVFQSTDGLKLRGCYLRTSVAQRRGVILFGLEFGSNCWGAVAYCEQLLANGYDVFTFEPRNQGDSASQPGYEPLQWVTDYEVRDFDAAIAYLQSRPDADPDGIGFFGISKGGGAGLLAAARNPYVRCFVTDGIFAVYTTMIPYMRKWIGIYSSRRWLHVIMPTWYYGLVGNAGIRRIERESGCHFPHLEDVMSLLAPRPLLMIHGGGDTYIKPEMALALFDRAKQPKEFWQVEGAKHNQALYLAGDEYHRRVLSFFEAYLAGSTAPKTVTGRRDLGRRASESAPHFNGVAIGPLASKNSPPSV
jgi:pimeloyl-ACP methyl ester carboxylesterase